MVTEESTTLQVHAVPGRELTQESTEHDADSLLQQTLLQLAAAKHEVLMLHAELKRLYEVALDILDDYETVQREYHAIMSQASPTDPELLKTEIENKRLRLDPRLH